MTETLFLFVEKRPTHEMRNHNVADSGRREHVPSCLFNIQFQRVNNIMFSILFRTIPPKHQHIHTRKGFAPVIFFDM